MPSEKPNKKLQSYVTERHIAEIKDVMDSRGMNQSQATRILISLGYECHKDLSRLGIIRLVDLFTSLKKGNFNHRG